MLAATQVTQVTEHWSISIAFKSISTSRSSSSFNMTASRNQACHQRQLMLLMLMMISTYCIRSSGFLICSNPAPPHYPRSRNVELFFEKKKIHSKCTSHRGQPPTSKIKLLAQINAQGIIHSFPCPLPLFSGFPISSELEPSRRPEQL